MEKNEPCDSANVREQNMGSGRAGVSSGVTEPPAGSLSYSRLFVRLGKATSSDDSLVTGSWRWWW